MTKLNVFDAVVIGSGLGGLTAAALLTNAGRSVCVLERNHSLGGAASVFKVGALTIEASLHQTADPRDPRDPKHQILKELGILDEIDGFLSRRSSLYVAGPWGHRSTCRTDLIAPVPLLLSGSRRASMQSS